MVGACAVCGVVIVWPKWAPAQQQKVCCSCLAPYLRDKPGMVVPPPRPVQMQPPAKRALVLDEEWAI